MNLLKNHLLVRSSRSVIVRAAFIFISPLFFNFVAAQPNYVAVPWSWDVSFSIGL